MSEILDHLAAAFGGYSQLNDRTIGEALITNFHTINLNMTNEN